MTDKPILRVEIDDTEFKNFAKLFDEYKVEAAKQPEAWSEVGKTAKDTADNFDKINRSMRKTARPRKPGETEGRSRERLDVAWSSISYNSKRFFENIKGASLSLMKWGGLTGVFSSIVGAGGLFGITRMAMNVSANRMNASGLGVNYGAKSAFNTALGRLGNTDSLLSGFHRALTGANERSVLLGVMGPNANSRLAGKDAAGAAIEALPDIQRLLKKSPRNSVVQTAEAYHLSALGIDANMAVLLRDMSPEELKSILDQGKSMAQRLDLSPALQKSFRDFMDQLERAELTVRTHFERVLVKLTPGIGKVTDAVVGLFGVFLGKNSPIGDWLSAVDDGMKFFAQEVQNAPVDKWMSEVASGIKSLGNLVSQIGANKDPATGAFGQAPRSKGQAKANRWFNALGRFLTGRDQIPEGKRRLYDAARRGKRRMPSQRKDYDPNPETPKDAPSPHPALFDDTPRSPGVKGGSRGRNSSAFSNPKLAGGGHNATHVEQGDSSTHVVVRSQPYGALPSRSNIQWSQ